MVCFLLPWGVPKTVTTHGRGILCVVPLQRWRERCAAFAPSVASGGGDGEDAQLGRHGSMAAMPAGTAAMGLGSHWGPSDRGRARVRRIRVRRIRGVGSSRNAAVSEPGRLETPLPVRGFGELGRGVLPLGPAHPFWRWDE